VESLRGHLLVARPELFDPNFRRSVVLIGEHNEEGALGVVINRPTPVTVADAIPPLAPLTEPGGLLFIGGPVEPEGAVVLAEFEEPGLAGLLVFERVGFLIGDLDAEVALSTVRARVFAGHSGWGPGQLEDELEAGGWIVEPALAEDVFSARPELLWGAVLRRKGAEFAMLSTMPLDPSQN
jgi:putative transcriptional regulator